MDVKLYTCYSLPLRNFLNKNGMRYKLAGKPSQMVCICNNKCVVCYYPIELN